MSELLSPKNKEKYRENSAEWTIPRAKFARNCPPKRELQPRYGRRHFFGTGNNRASVRCQSFQCNLGPA